MQKLSCLVPSPTCDISNRRNTQWLILQKMDEALQNECSMSASPGRGFCKRRALSPWSHASASDRCECETARLRESPSRFEKENKDKGDAMKRWIFIDFIAVTSSPSSPSSSQKPLEATLPFRGAQKQCSMTWRSHPEHLWKGHRQQSSQWGQPRSLQSCHTSVSTCCSLGRLSILVSTHGGLLYPRQGSRNKQHLVSDSS